MSDYLVRALAFDGNVRAYAARTTEAVKEAQKRHTTWPTASAAMGRAMTAGVMMGYMIKNGKKITITIQGGGPIGAIVVDATPTGDVRAYVSNPHVHFDLNEQGKLDVRRAVGVDGFLSVAKDLGLRNHFTGQVPIISGELGDDFTYYFVHSEQIPSAVGVGVLVNPDNSVLASGGFIIQLMPGANEEIIAFIEKRVQNMTPVSKLIEEGKTPEEIIEEVLGEGEAQFLDRQPVAFRCQCSRDRFSAAIISLGAGEIEDMIVEDGQAEAECHFCNERYYFSKDELEEMKKEALSV
ncbi:Hsp33 family molecular chaperone HslO [Bacillaceae bacterium SIJ1]|uniref:Hsp33 family molecular chaperone HslO n=1 Tax=Litoribacterium kuwaitense TaxID=1398745 RepID=UPI0013EABA40|nr:Hsp33 family molecular chaperone HslO [Litoribacterium kuwaitense]NGP45816.1 Hsp33 family molecular chaperone HslO [Litoribacterium kuwaitense]